MSVLDTRYPAGPDAAPAEVGIARQLRGRPAFLVAAGVLLVTAICLNGAVQMLQLHFKKLPVPLRHSLGEIPTTLGPWVQVDSDQPLDPEMVDNLGTSDYIFRAYVNKAELLKTEPGLSARLTDLSNRTIQERQKLLNEIRAKRPEAVVSVGVTYYTGKADTVPHIPERCYLADGYTQLPDSGDVKVAGVPALAGADLRVLTFEPEGRGGGARVNVGYLFQVNGEYTSSFITVRSALQSLRVKHAYFAKVELMTLVPDRARSAQVMTEFLRAAMPDVVRALPDWGAYRTR